MRTLRYLGVVAVILAGMFGAGSRDLDRVIRNAFAGGEDGIWVAPRLGGMFQDAALATPWTADGQPVGGYVDRSPNGYVLTQATTTARPAGYDNRLSGDGADDYLSGGDILNVRAAPYFAVTVMQFNAFGGTQWYAAKGTATGRYSEGVVSDGRPGSSIVTSDGTNTALGAVSVGTAPVVLSMIANRPGGPIVQRVNGVQVGVNGYTSDGTDYQPAGAYALLAYSTGTTAFVDGSMFERVQVMRAPVAGEIEAIEARLIVAHGISV